FLREVSMRRRMKTNTSNKKSEAAKIDSHHD
ncbi:MAG: hypothetical protein RL137_1295, partial [Bacteroidota bacterium]